MVGQPALQRIDHGVNLAIRGVAFQHQVHLRRVVGRVGLRVAGWGRLDQRRGVQGIAHFLDRMVVMVQSTRWFARSMMLKVERPELGSSRRKTPRLEMKSRR